MTSPSWFGFLKLNRAFTSVKAACHKTYRRITRGHLLVERLEDRTVPSGGPSFPAPVNDLTLITALESSGVVVADPSLLLGPFAAPNTGQGFLPVQTPWFPNAYGLGSGTKPGQPWAPAAYSVALANQPSFPWGPAVAYGQWSGNSSAQGEQLTPMNELGDNDNQGDGGRRKEGQRIEGPKPEGQRDMGQGDESTGDNIEELRGPEGESMTRAHLLTMHAALFVGEPDGGEVNSGEGGLPKYVSFSQIDSFPVTSIKSDSEAPELVGVRIADLHSVSTILLVSTLARCQFSAIFTGFARFPALMESAAELLEEPTQQTEK